MPISFLCWSTFGRRMTSQSVFISNRYCLSPPEAGPNWRVCLLVSLSGFDALGSAVAFYLWGNRRLNPVNLACNTSFPSVRPHACFLCNALSCPGQPVWVHRGPRAPDGPSAFPGCGWGARNRTQEALRDTRAFQCVCFKGFTVKNQLE